jgi:hypothetical protein
VPALFRVSLLARFVSPNAQDGCCQLLRKFRPECQSGRTTPIAGTGCPRNGKLRPRCRGTAARRAFGGSPCLRSPAPAFGNLNGPTKLNWSTPDGLARLFNDPEHGIAVLCHQFSFNPSLVRSKRSLSRSTTLRSLWRYIGTVGRKSFCSRSEKTGVAVALTPSKSNGSPLLFFRFG